MKLATFLVQPAVFVLATSAMAAHSALEPVKSPALSASITTGSVAQDKLSQTITMADAHRNLSLRLNYGHGCVLDQVVVDGREVISAATGVYTGIESGGQWSTTQTNANPPQIRVSGHTVYVDGIRIAAGSVAAKENWIFTVKSDGIDWQITRTYETGGQIDDTCLPAWDFADRNTWTGGILNTGGVAWCHLLGDNATYGAHASAVTFWKPDQREALRITTTPAAGLKIASRFTQLPSGVFTYVQSAAPQELATKHGLRRYMGSGSDLWAPFQVTPGSAQADINIQAIDYNDAYGRGDLKGIDGAATTQLLNTIGRYGAIDRHIVSGNGWVTGFVCLHEPFCGTLAAAVDDPNYTANLATSLDDWRDHAVKPDGRVMARWVYENGMDNMVPGTYNPATGYYDCGWGMLLDAQPDYPIDVSEEFDLNGDTTWLRGHKKSCEGALDWMLARDFDGSGLMSMMTDSRTQRKSSDWIDIVFACGKNALVNAEMYNALTQWAGREDILGDKEHAAKYREAAAKLKSAFIRPISQGGFWNPDKGYFDYWLEKDGSAHGDNLVIPVNFCAVSYDICTGTQRKSVLDNIDSRMQQENLFHWPLCFTSYAPDECMGQMPFPNYENGDIFLSWGELGVRAYAGYDRTIAVKYVRAILDRYQKDGLAFQRYLRNSQSGAGDDILAGNSMTIAGLYRDIYGIRPQWNRLMLDPHITPDLAGTQLRYQLRKQWYNITPGVTRSSVAVDGATVKSAGAFAINASGGKLLCYPGASDRPAFSFTRPTGSVLSIDITAWPGAGSASRWTEKAKGKPFSVARVLSGLSPRTSYRVTIDGKTAPTITSNAEGSAELHQFPASERSTTFVVTPVRS